MAQAGEGVGGLTLKNQACTRYTPTGVYVITVSRRVRRWDKRKGWCSRWHCNGRIYHQMALISPCNNFIKKDSKWYIILTTFMQNVKNQECLKKRHRNEP